MIYTYEISLNSSDYLEFTPTNIPKIGTEKMENKFIWRDNVDSFKINKALNSSLYDTLESWYEDSTKYPYVNKIRIKKSGTVKWNFIFGIKAGTINYENKYYEVSPDINDQYTDLMFYKDRGVTNPSPKTFHYNNEDEIDTDTVDELHESDAYLYEDWMTKVITKYNLLSDNTYSKASNCLWDDSLPTGPSGSYPQVNQLLATSRLGDTNLSETEIEHLLDIPKQFECYWFCGSDYVIHFEHASWFLDNIADSQLDISGENYYDDARVFQYSNPELVSSEKFFFPTYNGPVDYDNAQILYDPTLVSYNAIKKEIRTEYDAYISSDFADLDKFMVVGNSELAVGYQYVNGWTTFTNDGPDVTTGSANGSGNEARTNYVAEFNSKATISYDLNLTYISTPVNALTLQGYDQDGTANGSPVTLSVGSNTGTVTGDHIRIKSTGNQTFNYTLSLEVTNRYRIPWEAGAQSSTSRQNNYLAWANVIETFWLDNRYALEGIINGSDVSLGVRMLKEQNEFKFYYADDIDPMRGITTDYGVGMIQTMERDLASDFITVKLRYE